MYMNLYEYFRRMFSFSSGISNNHWHNILTHKKRIKIVFIAENFEIQISISISWTGKNPVSSGPVQTLRCINRARTDADNSSRFSWIYTEYEIKSIYYIKDTPQIKVTTTMGPIEFSRHLCFQSHTSFLFTHIIYCEKVLNLLYRMGIFTFNNE